MRLTGRSKTSGKPVSSRSADRSSVFAVGVIVGLSLAIIDRSRCAAGAKQPSQSTEAAESPTDLSARSWKRVLVRTWREFSEDRIPAVAAGATFYGLLALFPAIGAFVSLYGLFAHVEDAKQQIASLKGIFPEGGITVITDQMTRLADAPHAGLGVTFLVSLLLSVWSSNAGVKAVIAGLNIAYEERERRNFVVLNLASLIFTAGAIVFALITAAAISVAPAIINRLGLPGLSWVSILRWPALLLVVLVALSLLYRYGPSRARARWRWITPGGGLAAASWLAMSVGYSIYVGNFGHFDRTYGSLGAVVGFMTWIWLSLIVVLLGAELNSELEQQTADDTTTGPARPPGQRGAAVADGERQQSA
jgi:membrane protein